MAGVPPAVEGGILPPGSALKFSKALPLRTSIPPGETPNSKAGRTPAATWRMRRALSSALAPLILLLLAGCDKSPSAPAADATQPSLSIVQPAPVPSRVAEATNAVPLPQLQYTPTR